MATPKEVTAKATRLGNSQMKPATSGGGSGSPRDVVAAAIRVGNSSKPPAIQRRK